MHPAQTLKAHDFFLRPWTRDDAAWYVESRDEEVFKWTSEKKDLTVNDAAKGIEDVNNSANAIGFAIVDSSGLEILGSIALAFRESTRESIEIMYWLAPWGRGRGIAANSVKLVCKWAFEVLEIERVTLKTHPENIRSQLVAKRAGFRRRPDAQNGPSDPNVWFELKKDEARRERQTGAGTV